MCVCVCVYLSYRTLDLCVFVVDFIFNFFFSLSLCLLHSLVYTLFCCPYNSYGNKTQDKITLRAFEING